MPIYEYQCRKCQHAFEHLARRLSEPAPACPKCQARNPEKQLSTFSASVASNTPAIPCAGGSCPGGSAGGCAGGSCPFSG